MLITPVQTHPPAQSSPPLLLASTRPSDSEMRKQAGGNSIPVTGPQGSRADDGT